MQFLYATPDRAFWEYARLMLHAEGIRTWESDVDPTLTALGSVLGHREYRLYIINNDDLSRAHEILLEIGAYHAAPLSLPNSLWMKMGLVVLGIVIVLLFGLLT